MPPKQNRPVRRKAAKAANKSWTTTRRTKVARKPSQKAKVPKVKVTKVGDIEDVLLNCLNKINTARGTKCLAKKHYDENDAIAISWTAKLKKLDCHQRILAEDLINDIFKKAILKRLSQKTVVIDIKTIRDSDENTKDAMEIVDY